MHAAINRVSSLGNFEAFNSLMNDYEKIVKKEDKKSFLSGVFSRRTHAVEETKNSEISVQNPDGSKAWYKDGLLHRNGAPAVTHSDGAEEWYQNGKIHREDDPDMTYRDGREEYWVRGKEFTEEEFNSRDK